MIYQVSNVYEAVDLAEKLKISGAYDWFRGQTQNWPLVSSFCRVPEARRDDIKQKLSRFGHWIKNTSGLESIAANHDMTIAVAQHYGLPTNFVDFTTEPSIAGFFASQGKPSNRRPSCIICLNTRVAELWEGLSQTLGVSPPEFIRITVPNLWRLESQHGTFLFCPFPNIEDMVNLDRIVFPYTEPVSKLSENHIYPSRKSQLEILLDQYFNNERSLEVKGILRDKKTIEILSIPSMPDKCDPDRVLNEPPPRLGSWNGSTLESHLKVIPEVLSEKLASERWELAIDPVVDPLLRMLQIRDYIQPRLSRTPGVRWRLLEFSLRFKFSLRFNRATMRTDKVEAITTRAMQRLWDGLRVLPYSDHQIAEGIGCCATIAAEYLNSSACDGWESICQRVFPDAMQVEFGSDDGSYSRAFVSESALLNAVRDDIDSFLDPAYVDHPLGNMAGIFRAIWAPDRLFEYDKLSHLFATRIAPIQVWMREGSAIFYSPARLDSFGLP